jgi:predicted ATP-grasp superfamily ATP-dependent carboligase
LSEVEVIEPIALKKTEYIAILGFAGAGFVANTALMFAVRNKGYKQVASVESKLIPSMVLIFDGAPQKPFRIYIDEAEGLLFVVTESLLPSESVWPISERLFEWLGEKGVKEIYAFEGLPFSGLPENIKALGFTMGGDLSKIGIQPLREGAISGLTACISELSLSKKVPFTCLFVPTRVLTSVDYGSSAVVVDLLNNLWKLGVDPGPLRRSDEAMRKAAEQRQGMTVRR